MFIKPWGQWINEKKEVGIFGSNTHYSTICTLHPEGKNEKNHEFPVNPYLSIEETAIYCLETGG